MLRRDAAVYPKAANAADVIEASDTMLGACHGLIKAGLHMTRLLSLVLVIVGLVDGKTILNLRKEKISGVPGSTNG